MTTMTQQVLAVTVGVDTHADAHVAAAVDVVGAILGTASFPATARGYAPWCAGRSGWGLSSASALRALGAMERGWRS